MKTARIIYDSLQSQSGTISFISDSDVSVDKHFERLEIIGSRLVIYVDDGLTRKGRIGGLYNLDDYNVLFN